MLENLLRILPYKFEKNECIIMMCIKPSSKIVKFIALSSQISALGQGKYALLEKMYLRK